MPVETHASAILVLLIRTAVLKWTYLKPSVLIGSQDALVVDMLHDAVFVE